MHPALTIKGQPNTALNDHSRGFGLENNKQQVPPEAESKQACALEGASAKALRCFAKLMRRDSLQCLWFLELSCMTVPCSLKCVNV